MWDFVPWLVTMLVLVACSAFFSASEAALFSLPLKERRALANGSPAERRADQLLQQPERLLSAVLFWNLVVNLAFFALSSMVAIRLEEDSRFGQSATAVFAIACLLVLIFFSEMLPKSFAVIRSRWLATQISMPLSVTIRAVDPIVPLLRGIMLVSQRLVWPGLRHESPMEPDDLRRAIEFSTDDSEMILHEQAVLRNIVELSDIRVDEWMLPRSQFTAMRPPVSLEELKPHALSQPYLLITEESTDEIAQALHLHSVWDLPDQHIEYLAEAVLYIPWCATLAEALEEMKRKNREVVAVVNEHGETIGILTMEDMLDTLFSFSPSRSKRVLNQNPVHLISTNRWLVSGMTSLRRLGAELGQQVPDNQHVTVCGVIQESLHRLASVGDECDWGPFRFRVLEMPHRGHLLVQVTLNEEAST